VSTLLEVSNLKVALGNRKNTTTIVDNVGFAVDNGRVFGLAGESGSGKTLTALSLVGLGPPAAHVAGSVIFAGTDLLSLGPRALRAIRGAQIGFVFQDPLSSLHPMLTIERQLTEHIRHHLHLKQRQARARAAELLTEVRIPDPNAALRGYPHQFSGGMRQRLQIAMALACEPKLLIADEPTTALDVTVQAGILRLLNRLCRERGLAVILITHDIGVLSGLADTITVMYAGRVVESGPTASVVLSPRHPYTRGLLDSLPHPERHDQPLTPIKGAPAAAHNRPPGCPFHPRCGYAIDQCRHDVPPLVRTDDGRLLACPVDPFRTG
jgi:oligopeptide transport system ATP-binding protein